MKLKHFYIDGYKNLENFKLDFQNQDRLTILIGNNGSGKSNIFEAISAIFAEVFSKRKKNNVNKQLKNGIKYQIDYEINDAIISIRNNKGNLVEYFVDEIKKDKKYIINNQFAPSKVIAVYSGEELRLWEQSYEPIYKSYIADIIGGSQGTPKQQMVYINKYYWNIALLMLLVANFPYSVDISPKQIGCLNCSVWMSFNLKNIATCKNLLLKSFMEKLNPENEENKLFTFMELYSKLFKEQISEKEITFSLGAGVIRALDNFNLIEIFNNFVNSYMPKKKKLIEDMRIILPDGVENGNLSEGEKKIILLKFVLDIVADENSIILLDEPDAHIHEGRKKKIYDILQKYSIEYNRQIVVTTHSPTLIHCSDDKHIIMLQNDENGNSEIVPYEKITAINNLTNGIWSAVEQNIFLISNKPLLLVEGKGDVEYIKKAIEILKADNVEYEKLDLDMLPFGGADNANYFINELKQHIDNDKKCIVLFDRDDQGGIGLKACIGRGKDKNDIKTYHRGSWYYLKLPKTGEHAEDEFVIEDYFSISYKNFLAQNFVNNANGAFKKYTKDLRESIKHQLGKELDTYDSEKLIGFKVLLDKLVAIIDESEVVEEL